MQIFKDTLPIGTTFLNEAQMQLVKKKQIPALKGKLFTLDDYGNEIFLKDNTVVLGGVIAALERLFGVPASFKPATLNTIYNVNSSVVADENSSYIALFGVGIGGAGLDFGNVIDPDFKQREIINFIPFRVSDTDTLTATDASKYYFRKQLNASPLKYGWYLKEFELPVTIKSAWKDNPISSQDGTEIISEVYNSASTNGIESFAECQIKITPDDIKPYFEYTGNVEKARYNSIGLFIGKKVLNITSGYNDYVNVKLFSVVNIDNKSAKEREETTFIYRVYGAV
jgi:hypothetical protein